MTHMTKDDQPAGPTKGSIIGTIVFWVIAILLVVFTTVWTNLPAGVWVVRILTVLAGVGMVVGLILYEKYRKSHGLPVESDETAFDLWTIAHTLAGVVMGAWTVAAPLVVIFTIVWEFFEKFGSKGIGDKEILANRIVDVLVAWAGWFVVAAVIAATTQTPMPWTLSLAR